MKNILALIILLPLSGAVLNALFGARLNRRVCEVIACGAIWGSFVATLAAFASYREPVSMELLSWLSDFDFSAPLALYLDPLSMALCLMITSVCGLIHLYSIGYMADDPCHVRYFALLNLFVAAMLLLVLAENLPLLYMGWEGVGFCSYGLIGFWYREKKNADAGRKAFIVTRVGDIALGVAIVWLFELSGTVSITKLNALGAPLPIAAVTAIGLLLLVGAMGKSAQMPLMVWLPDAMAGPTPVSAQIHAATMVTAGVYLLMRMLPLIGTSGPVMAAIAVTGGVTAFFGASCALAQRDLKRVLAYSTISQIGFMMLGVGAGAVTAATFHLLVHAFFKALLFLAAGCVITFLHHEQDIFRMGGVRRTLPLVFWPFLAGSLCLAGVPLTGGFFSKDSILTAVWERGGGLYTSLYLLGLATALLTAFYTFRTLILVFGGERTIPPFDKGGGGGISTVEVHKDIPLLMLLTLIPLALMGLFGGLLNLPPLFGHGVLDSFLGPLAKTKGEHLSSSVEIALLLVASLASLTGMAYAWFRYGGNSRVVRIEEAKSPASGLSAFLLHGWYVDELYRFLFITPFVRLSRILWERVDGAIIDSALNSFAVLLGRSGSLLGRWSCGRVSVYLLSLAAGAALLLAWFAGMSYG